MSHLVIKILLICHITQRCVLTLQNVAKIKLAYVKQEQALDMIHTSMIQNGVVISQQKLPLN